MYMSIIQRNLNSFFLFQSKAAFEGLTLSSAADLTTGTGAFSAAMVAQRLNLIENALVSVGNKDCPTHP